MLDLPLMTVFLLILIGQTNQFNNIIVFYISLNTFRSRCKAIGRAHKLRPYLKQFGHVSAISDSFHDETV